MRTIAFSLLLASLMALIACGREVQSTQASQEAKTQIEPGQEVPAPAKIISEKLGPADFAKKLAESPDAQLIDVRTPEEVANGYLEGMTNIDYASSDKEEQLNQLDRNKPVFVYCAAGGRSGRAASILEQNGFTEIYDLAGGMTKWKAAGMDFVKK